MRWTHSDALAWAALGGTTVVGLVASAWWVVEAAKERRLGVDVVAVLALAGALLVDELLAGALITVMMATGRWLEGWAAGRAERDLRALLERTPTIVHRYVGQSLTDVALEDVRPGDLRCLEIAGAGRTARVVRPPPVLIGRAQGSGRHEQRSKEADRGDAQPGEQVEPGSTHTDPPSHWVRGSADPPDGP